jgi:DNA-directed RNA polymerase I subunit RPA12
MSSKIEGPPFFCPACGTIFLISGAECITCNNCSYNCKMDDLQAQTVTVDGDDRKKPDWIPDHQTDTSDKLKRVMVEEPCPECNAPEVEFYTMQLRSADEGQTVFYECPNCKHKWKINN